MRREEQEGKESFQGGPRVVRARHMGFCMGVRRAINLADKVAEEAGEGTPVGTLGPLIHNERVIRKMEERGVQVYPGEEIPREGVVVIRAHGIPRERQRLLEEKENLRLEDGTCPRVVRNQQKVEEWSRRGIHVIIAGDADHGEIVSLESYAESSSIVLTVEDVQGLELKGPCALIAQTTLKAPEWQAVKRAVLERRPDTEVFESICAATRLRQEALDELCRKVDAVLVIGGRQSANTRRLYEKAVENGLPAWHITGAEELPREVGAYPVVGITAGASTPDWIVEEVEEALAGS